MCVGDQQHPHTQMCVQDQGWLGIKLWLHMFVGDQWWVLMYDRDMRLPHMYLGDQRWQHINVGDNRGSTCMLGSNVDTHLCWMINGGRKCVSSIDGRHTFMFEIKDGHICM